MPVYNEKTTLKDEYKRITQCIREMGNKQIWIADTKQCFILNHFEYPYTQKIFVQTNGAFASVKTLILPHDRNRKTEYAFFINPSFCITDDNTVNYSYGYDHKDGEKLSAVRLNLCPLGDPTFMRKWVQYFSIACERCLFDIHNTEFPYETYGIIEQCSKSFMNILRESEEKYSFDTEEAQVNENMIEYINESGDSVLFTLD